MVKVLVVLYGLVMLVPTGESDGYSTGLTAIFVDGGSHVSADHQPLVHWVQPDGTLESWDLPSGYDFWIEIVSPESGEINLDARSGFAELRPLFTRAGRGYVERGCARPGGDCERGGDDLTHGVTTVSGRWRTREATYCDGFKRPIADYDDEAFEFRRSRGGSRNDQGSDGLGTALVLEIDLDDVDDLDALSVKLNGDAVDLVKIEDSDVCRDWVGDGYEACAVLLMGNPPYGYGTCHGKGCRLDKHFTAFYRLTDDPPVRFNRWLPYLLGDTDCPRPTVRTVPRPDPSAGKSKRPRRVGAELTRGPLLVTKPAVRCPPTFATIEPESGPEE